MQVLGPAWPAHSPSLSAHLTPNCFLGTAAQAFLYTCYNLARFGSRSWRAGQKCQSMFLAPNLDDDGARTSWENRCSTEQPLNMVKARNKERRFQRWVGRESTALKNCAIRANLIFALIMEMRAYVYINTCGGWRQARTSLNLISLSPFSPIQYKKLCELY